MKKLRKLRKGLAIFLTVAMVMGLMPGTGMSGFSFGTAIVASAAEILYSGDCGAEGNNLTWTLDDAGKLTISGSGAMNDWSAGAAPWSSVYRDDIKSVEIGENITSIGAYAFRDCTNLTSINIPASVTTIGEGAFHNCLNFLEVLC